MGLDMYAFAVPLTDAKHGFQLFAGEDFKNLMAFGRDVESAHDIKENT